MHALVSICCASGALRRYERIGDGSARMTHEVIPDGWGPGWEWLASDVDTFRTTPPSAYAQIETPLLKPEHDAPWRCDPPDVA